MDATQLPCPRWEVDLDGNDLDLQHLLKHATSGAWTVYKDARTGQTLMVVDGLPMEAPYTEVLAAAEMSVKELSGVLKVLRQLSGRPLRVVGVMQRQLDGTRHVYLPTREMRLVLSGRIDASLCNENGQLVPVPQGPPPTVALAALVKVDSAMAKAMRLAVAADAESWKGLVPLFEVIEHDVLRAGSSLVAKGWVSKKQQKRFEHTANSSAAGDDSRHGHERHAPPQKPMALSEARAFVQMVLQAWVADRLAEAVAVRGNIAKVGIVPTCLEGDMAHASFGGCNA